MAIRKSHLLAALGVAVPSVVYAQGNYLLLAADSQTNADAIAASLLGTGAITNLTVMAGNNIPTPTLAELLQYNAVLTYSNQNYASGAEMGDMLADYVDVGGGVVVAVFAVSTTTANRSLTGRWETGGYEIIPARSGNNTTAASLGTVHDPLHPIWGGTVSFTGGTGSTKTTTTLINAHGTRIADWSLGQALIATSTTMPGRVDLNMYPVQWHGAADGARIMANALVYAGSGPGPAEGGCCMTDGTCAVMTPSACALAGGNFRGQNTDCVDPCPQPAACCYPDGSCEVTLEATCTANGGVFNPGAPDCQTANCPQPKFGACCLPDGTCVIDWVGGCAALGGIYGGDNTTCATATCGNVVVPNANGTVAGPTSNSFPFTTTGAYMRHQQVYASSEFTGVGGPMTITSIRFRPNPSSTAPTWSTTFDLTMTVSTTAAAPDGLSATFADNHGANVAVVYSGEITLSTEQTTPVQGVTAFDVIVDLQTPFVYDPSQGNLLVDVERNGSTIGTNRFLDAVSATGDPTSRVSSSTVGATTGTLSSIGLITQFLVETKTGGECYANCDGSTTEPILNVADFTCFLSKFAAGDPYANCDGSTTEPILNVADFTCFLSKFAAGC
jgi:hypothetical protein